MQEISGRQEDIIFDLEQIKLLTQQKDALTDNEKDELKHLPLKKRKAEKEELLAQKERRRKEFIRIWIVELEEKVRASDLPPEIKAQILDMTTYAKERNMTFMYSVEEKIDHIQAQIKEAEAKEEEKKIKEMVKTTAEAVVAPVVLATVAEIGIEAYKKAHPEWYHVQYSPEKLEQTSVNYFSNKIVQEMAEMKLPIPAEKTYSQKQGSQYSIPQKKAAEAERNGIIEFAYQKAKEAAEKMGKRVPNKVDFEKYWDKLPEVKKRAAQKTFAVENPEKAKKLEQAKQSADKLALEKGIERLRRKHAQKESKMKKKMSQQSVVVPQNPKRTNYEILRASSQAVKSEERVREKAQAIPDQPTAKSRVIRMDFKHVALVQSQKKNKQILKDHSAKSVTEEKQAQTTAQKTSKRSLDKTGAVRIEWVKRKVRGKAA